MTRRVVLVGGGYVTLHAYRALARRLHRQLREGAVEIVVVSADDAHSFHGFTGEVLAGQIGYDRTRTPLADTCPRARFLHARVVSVDVEHRTLVHEPVGSGTLRSLPWDELVVGTGGREPVADVPGLTEHGHTLRGPGEIAALADRVALLADTAPPPAVLPAEGSTSAVGRRTVVVAGGGLAGVELAAAAAQRGRGRLAVHVVHSGDRLVPELHDQPRLAARTTRELGRLGVTVHLGARLAAVTADAATLADGTTLPARTVVAAIGQRPVLLPGLEAFRDDTGRLRTSPALAVTDGVWAAGDAARVEHPVTGGAVPANALWAIKAGAHAGRNAARSLLGERPRPFRYRGLGRAASFGPGRSVAELYGIPLTGVLAWLLRLLFFLRFMPSRRRAAGVLADVARTARRRAVERHEETLLQRRLRLQRRPVPRRPRTAWRDWDEVTDRPDRSNRLDTAVS